MFRIMYNVYIFWGYYRTNGYKYYILFFSKDPSKFHTLDPKNEIALHFQQNLNICICTITKSVLHMALDTD